MHCSIDPSINLPSDWVIHQAAPSFSFPFTRLSTQSHLSSLSPLFLFFLLLFLFFYSLLLYHRLGGSALINTLAKCGSFPQEPDLLDPQWSVWSDWSPCSRTCDGGATYQTRICLDHSRGCATGNNIRYQICNMQVKHFCALYIPSRYCDRHFFGTIVPNAMVLESSWHRTMTLSGKRYLLIVLYHATLIWNRCE